MLDQVQTFGVKKYKRWKKYTEENWKLDKENWGNMGQTTKKYTDLKYTKSTKKKAKKNQKEAKSTKEGEENK